MKTVAYLRVSTRSQDLANQKPAILEFSQKRRFPIDQFIESRISSRQSPLERRIDELRERAQAARLSMGAYLRRRALGQRVRMAAELRLGAAELRELNRIGVWLGGKKYGRETKEETMRKPVTYEYSVFGVCT